MTAVRLLAAATGAVAMSGALAAGAQAAPGRIIPTGPGLYSYWAEGETSSELEVSAANGRWVFTDTGVTSITSDGVTCQQGAAPNIVSCLLEPAQSQLSVYLGDGDDYARVDESAFPQGVGGDLDGVGPVILRGEAGDDTLIGNSKGVRLDGGDGNDVLLGGAAIDTLYGGVGDDLIRGGSGGDRIRGDAGIDTVTYADGRTSGVRAVLNGVTTSGSAQVDGVGDTLTTIERVTGTPYTDAITGNEFDNYINGNGGADQLNGLAGNDTLKVTGGPSWIDGGVGNDLIQSKNGVKDNLACGDGADSGLVDLNDLALPFSNCEVLTI